MSLSSALNTSVGGLRAQSAQIAAVSENIANSSTTAYKTRNVDFRALVVGNNTRSSNVTGGVLYGKSQNITSQGLIQATDSATHVALNGNGFLVVSDDLNNQPSGYTYTRNGQFKTDAKGFLINTEGYYLMGQRTDAQGNVTATNPYDLNSLVPVDANAVSGIATATRNIRTDINLPADATAGSSFQSSLEVFDSLGVSHTISVTWTKHATDPNRWSAALSDPVLTNNPGGGASGTSAMTIDILFNGDGTVQSFNGATTPPPLNITGFTTGANNSAITLDMGAPGLTDGLTQFSSNTATPELDIKLIDQDGKRYGQLSGIEIQENGLVIAFFENGVRQPIYQLPVATFPNPNGLTHVNGTVYDESEYAGNLNLRRPGQGSAGVFVASALEMSGTDTSEEFNKMIVSQQAYSAGAQVISTTDDMFQALIGAVR